MASSKADFYSVPVYMHISLNKAATDEWGEGWFPCRIEPYA